MFTEHEIEGLEELRFKKADFEMFWRRDDIGKYDCIMVQQKGTGVRAGWVKNITDDEEKYFFSLEEAIHWLEAVIERKL